MKTLINKIIETGKSNLLIASIIIILTILAAVATFADNAKGLPSPQKSVKAAGSDVVSGDSIAETRALYLKFMPHMAHSAARSEEGRNPSPEAYYIDSRGELSQIFVEDADHDVVVHKMRERLSKNRVNIKRAAIGAVITIAQPDGAKMEAIKIVIESPHSEDNCRAWLIRLFPRTEEEIKAAIGQVEKDRIDDTIKRGETPLETSFPIARRIASKPKEVQCGGSMYDLRNRIF